MTNEPATRAAAALPPVATQATYQAKLDQLRAREKAHTREGDITYAVFCQGPYPESARYRAFMGWDMPWYSAQASLAALLPPPRQPGRMHLVCYLRDGDRVFETYWTTLRGVETMDNSLALMDLTAYGRQESWEDSPPGWPQQCTNTRTMAGPPAWPPVPEWPAGRPIPQWARLEAGHSDDLGTFNGGGDHPITASM